MPHTPGRSRRSRLVLVLATCTRPDSSEALHEGQGPIDNSARCSEITRQGSAWEIIQAADFRTHGCFKCRGRSIPFASCPNPSPSLQLRTECSLKLHGPVQVPSENFDLFRGSVAATARGRIPAVAAVSATGTKSAVAPVPTCSGSGSRLSFRK